MILHRLYELAVREGLLDDLAFEDQPVPFVVKIGAGGKYLGIEQRRGEAVIRAKKKGADSKRRPDKGKSLSVPRPHGNTANAGFARFFVDTLPRVLPLSDDERSARSRATFWEQIAQAAAETDDPALEAVRDFGARLDAYSTELRTDLAGLKPGPSDRCVFEWHEDLGKTVVERPAVRAWYRQFFESVTSGRKAAGPIGLCQVTGTTGPLPTTHTVKLSGIPGGLPTGVSIVSYDKAAFESYGLRGTANAGLGYAAADGYTRAVAALVANKLKGNPRTSVSIGGTVFLFWTREPSDTSFVMELEAPDPAHVEQLVEAAKGGMRGDAHVDPNIFYLLALSGNAARAVVREYLERPIPVIRENLGRWFSDLTIADPSHEFQGQPNNRFPLWQLAASTAFEPKRVAPDVLSILMRAALNGDAIPDSILAACVARLRAEGSGGFRAARLALIKLVLKRKEVFVSETHNPNETNPAYVCGELLQIFEQIQYAALGDVNATVTDKFFGTFSSAPGVVLGRLYANAQNHLRKLRGERPGSFMALDKLLTETSQKLATPPRGQLSLVQQGQFALGYYHQKARQFAEIAERKIAKSDKAAP